MTIRKTINRFGRKLLYLWIETKVEPSTPESLNIDPAQPVIYVLENRSWTNLLVLEAECKRLKLPEPMNRIVSPELSQWYSVYTIAPREPFKAWMAKKTKRSRMLRGVVETLNEHPDQAIQFVPVSVFWGKPVVKQNRWLPVLFSESWEPRGFFSKFLTILFHGHHTSVKFSEIINFSKGTTLEVLSPGATNTDDENTIDSLQETFSKHLCDVRTATIGPDVSHRATLLRDLITKPDVQAAIKQRSEDQNITEYKATDQARRYVLEIVANCTSITVQVMNRLLSYFWNKFYSGIEVNNAEPLQALSKTHELVYVPCHRSHIDYLLLSYVIYYEGLAIPYIAAGKNLNMPVIGSILRGGGAFFIRRSFKDDQLYSSIMFEYVAELVSKGVAIEYFVEGGRSRTGRLLKPKPGMLSMTIRGFLKYRQKPVAFIPVYIGYEKLLETKAYQAELSGEDKKSETFVNSVRSILSIRGNFGKVAANFGRPILLDDVLDQEQSTWREDAYDDAERPDWVRSSVGSVSGLIASHINQAAAVNAVTLISTVLLATPKQGMDERELLKMIAMYRDIIASTAYSDRLVVTQETGPEQIARVESLKMLNRHEHELGDILYLGPKHSVSLTYYRNNILHLMALPSVIACCFINKRTLPEKDITQLITMVYPFLQSELFLPWKKEELAGAIRNVLDVMCEQGLLERRDADACYSRRSFGTLRFVQINLLARVISPTLEVYYLTLALLARSGSETIPKAELEKRCQLMAQRVAMIHEINSPDYADKNLIANFIDTLIHIDYVKVYGTEDLAFSEVFQRADKRIRLLLGRATRSNIMQMLGQVEKDSFTDDEDLEHVELQQLEEEDKKIAKNEEKHDL